MDHTIVTWLVIVAILCTVAGIAILRADGSLWGALLAGVGAILIIIVGLMTTPADSAELQVKRVTTIAPTTLPRMITHGHGWGSIGRFGTYSDAWLSRRWRAMCAGSARYQAMGEAYDLGKSQPCR